jgi:hypothetical protein
MGVWAALGRSPVRKVVYAVPANASNGVAARRAIWNCSLQPGFLFERTLQSILDECRGGQFDEPDGPIRVFLALVPNVRHNHYGPAE